VTRADTIIESQAIAAYQQNTDATELDPHK